MKILFILGVLVLSQALQLQRHEGCCSTKLQWGGNTADWNVENGWALGDRSDQKLIMINVSPKGDVDLEGWVQYENEGPISFRAFRLSGNTYKVQYQWGGHSAPWNDAPSNWNIGGRLNQKVIYLNAVMSGN